MPAGRRWARIPASWPAKQTSSGSSPIAASTPASNVTPSRVRRGRELDLHARAARQRGRRRPPARRASRSAAPASGVRASIHSRTPDGTVVNAFGSTSMRAAVTRKSGSPPASSSAATISRAAAASASRRSPRRVVPAWSARPANVSARRMREASARTAPAGAPSRSRSCVWSMCSSTKPRRRLEPRRRVGEQVRVRAGRAHRVGERDPVVVAAREHVGDVEPPDQRARAERRRVEARALLVGERDHGDAGHALGHREARRDAERAVEAAAAADAVEVRARRPPGPRRVRDRPQRAGRIALHAQPGGARLLAEPRLGGGQLGRPGEPVRCRPGRARSARARRAGRAARPPRSRAHPPGLVGPHPDRARRRRTRRRRGCGRSGTGRARRGRRAAARRRACPPPASRAPRTIRARRRR